MNKPGGMLTRTRLEKHPNKTKEFVFINPKYFGFSIYIVLKKQVLLGSIKLATKANYNLFKVTLKNKHSLLCKEFLDGLKKKVIGKA